MGCTITFPLSRQKEVRLTLPARQGPCWAGSSLTVRRTGLEGVSARWTPLLFTLPATVQLRAGFPAAWKQAVAACGVRRLCSPVSLTAKEQV